MSPFAEEENTESPKKMRDETGIDRRHFLCGTAWAIGAAMAPGMLLRALERTAHANVTDNTDSVVTSAGGRPVYVHTKDKVPDPEDIAFTVRYKDKEPIKLIGHFWYNKEVVGNGKKCPAIVELNPYRRRDGMIVSDSKMYPWFAYNEYLCFRIDLQGSGDSQGVLTDEYTDEELSYCTQVIEQIAEHPWCDGNVGMMGESWSAINSLMVAGRSDCPAALKAIIVNCGNDDRYGDDVHYMGGAMMQDNAGWPSSMWGWLSQPPDPVVVGSRWKSMWRERIRNADFWFKRWAGHQTRDAYWRRASVRDRYWKVKVPVFIMSGWQDGYKNPVDRVVRGLAATETPVAGLIGPWGHKYPFGGYPGPRINWLPYAVTHWWDKWLKGKDPSPETELPQLTAWLGRSREPRKSADYNDLGKWVAEDSGWPSRVSKMIFYPSPGNRLSRTQPSGHASFASSPHVLYATEMLETSSFGSNNNDDLPGDLAGSDELSLFFETGALVEDLDCFGYPTATLNLSCDKPIASIAVRLCEVSPHTGASHLVSYRFFNLCYRDGDMATPKHIEPGVVFKVEIPLNLMGHTFRKGWRIRLSVSPSFFPTMWQNAEMATIALHTGSFDGFSASNLMLPARKPRQDDERVKALLPSNADIVSVYVDDYVPITEDPKRPGGNTRTVKRIAFGGRKGVLVKKVYDSGRCRYDGHLKGLWVDQVSRENFQILDDGPLSLTCFTSCDTVLERPCENWRVRARTSTRVWSERDRAGRYRLKYTATVRTFIGEAQNEKPFEQKTVKGSIPRTWV